VIDCAASNDGADRNIKTKVLRSVFLATRRDLRSPNPGSMPPLFSQQYLLVIYHVLTFTPLLPGTHAMPSPHFVLSAPRRLWVILVELSAQHNVPGLGAFEQPREFRDNKDGAGVEVSGF
jgi:hypothetical protein